MNKVFRLALRAASAAVVLALAACASSPMFGPTASSYPQSGAYPNSGGQVAGFERGRVTNIEFMPAGTAPAASGNTVAGAVVGGVLGAVVGRQIGGGFGRDVATVLGAGAGAVIGSQVARNAGGVTTASGYRVTIQTEQGVMRSYEVSSVGELRVGERVKVENGVIYRN